MAIDQNNPDIQALSRQLEAQLDAERVDRAIPGLSIAIVHDQDIVWAKGFGYADIEAEIPADPQTVYRVGSITKLFTATMLMQLRDAGKLCLDEPVEKYLPAFRLKTRFSDSSSPTFRQLASHTAGLPREAPVQTWLRTGEYSPIETVLESLKDAEMIFPPLMEIKYSNLGYIILGYALAGIAQQSYEHYVSENILRPLSMNNSGFTLSNEMKLQAAVGYSTSKDKPPELSPNSQFGALTPAAGLYSSVTDLARFISLQFRDGMAGGKQILKGSTLREMHAPVLLDPDWQRGFGIGWEVKRVANHPTISHRGVITGFLSDLILVQDMKLGLALSTNAQMDAGLGWSWAILEQIIPTMESVLAQEGVHRKIHAQADWEKYVGQYSVPGIIEVDLVIFEGNLVVCVPAGTPPSSDVVLVPETESTFRAKGGMVNGELVAFEMDDAGRVRRMKAGSYVLDRKQK